MGVLIRIYYTRKKNKSQILKKTEDENKDYSEKRPKFLLKNPLNFFSGLL